MTILFRVTFSEKVLTEDFVVIVQNVFLIINLNNFYNEPDRLSTFEIMVYNKSPIFVESQFLQFKSASHKVGIVLWQYGFTIARKMLYFRTSRIPLVS